MVMVSVARPGKWDHAERRGVARTLTNKVHYHAGVVHCPGNHGESAFRAGSASGPRHSRDRQGTARPVAKKRFDHAGPKAFPYVVQCISEGHRPVIASHANAVRVRQTPTAAETHGYDRNGATLWMTNRSENEATDKTHRLVLTQHSRAGICSPAARPIDLTSFKRPAEAIGSDWQVAKRPRWH